MKKIKIFRLIFLIIMCCTLFLNGCSFNTDQKNALSRLDPENVVINNKFGSSKDDLLNYDKDIQFINLGNVSKEINNYYGCPANLRFIFTSTGKFQGLWYQIVLDNNPRNFDLFNNILNDMMTAYGSEFSSPNNFNVQDLKNALQSQTNVTYTITWSKKNMPFLTFVIRDDKITNKKINLITVGLGE